VDFTLPTALCRATKRGVCVHGFGDGQNIENASDWKESFTPEAQLSMKLISMNAV
jgi:hypothetical protein